MAKIVVYYNFHPSEVVANSVAINVAKRLLSEGHQVILLKKPFKGSNLNTALEASMANPYHEMGTANQIRIRNSNKMVGFLKPDFVFDFHNQHTDASEWKKESKHKTKLHDFRLLFRPHSQLGDVPTITVEVRAAYKEMPKRVYEKVFPKIMSPIGKEGWFGDDYFYNYASHGETRKLGLEVDSLAKGIAGTLGKVILGRIKIFDMKSRYDGSDIGFSVRRKKPTIVRKKRK